jgi:superfamily II DNA or RNA helicase
MPASQKTFEQMQFQYPFRKYQEMILEHIVPDDDDDKYHLVAPPGSGKTIVGLELIRRFGEPAVVFAPTSTIQLQWAEKVNMFTNGQPATVDLASLDPKKLGLINIFTYQLISVPAAAKKHLLAMALRRWRLDLLEEGRAADEASAEQRITELKKNNPRLYSKEISRRRKRIKRELLRSKSVEVGEFLHPNARQLIDDLVAHGVQTVVLDECHHLLDYWAIVLRYLINKIAEPKVIGLTATLPSPDGDAEYENYTSLLGDVDFEVPTPAVVKEGDLAPYRDLVLFVQPSKREKKYLRNIQAEFTAAIAGLTSQKSFRDWVAQEMLAPQDDQGNPQAWADFWKQKPLLSVAGYRFLKHNHQVIPAAIPIPIEAQAKLELDDWLVLIEHFSLEKLALSPNEADHEILKHLKEVLYTFGFTLTERGLRQTRSPGDLVLTFSESKDIATADILTRESKVMGDLLRAVVVTDFEKMNSGVRRLSGVLDPDAGSAWRLFAHLVSDPNVARLNPILITGKTVMVSAANSSQMLDLFNQALQVSHANAVCEIRPTQNVKTCRIVGKGPDWKPRRYVRMITKLFEEGVTQCLVGTRGIFGEGWDSLSLNTLIDLTSVTTSTSVQQLRGRSFRKDPLWPRKVAHNWDVVCMTYDFERGLLDFKRFLRRHRQYWGLVVYPDEKKSAGAVNSPLWHGRISKGWVHVSPHINRAVYGDLSARNYLNWHNNLMIHQIPGREHTYDLWRVGEDYSNFAYHTTQLHTTDLKIRTVFTIQDTLKAMIRAFRASFAISFMLIFFQFIGSVFNVGSASELVLCGAGVLLLSFGVAFVMNLRQAVKLARKLLVEQPPDAILLDVGRAVLSALRAAKLVSPNLVNEYLRVVETETEAYQVFVDYASPDDAGTFTQAYRDVFAPVNDQRYLIMRTDHRVPQAILRPVWWVIRQFVRKSAGYPPAYHPVPKVLSTRKERAQAYAQYWEQYVGGGELIFTHSEIGRQVLLQARAQHRPDVKNLAFEFWR